MPKQEFQNTQQTERAVLVFVNPNKADDEYVEEELRELARTAELEVVADFRQRRPRPEQKTFLGKGMTQDLFAHLNEIKADVVIVDAGLSPVQGRNLEKILQTKVIDRPQLILDIFAQRAHSKEGYLQVELAQLSYLLPRLTTLYTQFERQQGGIGVRGPGETKLESDRQVVKKRISSLAKDIEELRRQRQHQRDSRRRYPFPFGTIVGYTSAGKSTLLNTLSGSEIFTDKKLFATLDPTTRRVVLTDGYSIFLTDTVGFIRNLPAGLVAAFKATLEEVSEADFLVHVVDVSNPKWELQHDVVLETLDALGAGNTPILTVFNKCDLVHDQYPLRELVSQHPNSVYISAKHAQGIPYLMDVLTKIVQNLLNSTTALVPYSSSDLVSDCYEYGKVISVDYREDGILIEAEVVGEMAARLKPYVVEK
ncbi:MAG: GTPase HflX [bacterium]